MWEFMNANSFGVFIAFLFTVWTVSKLIELLINKNRPVVQCDCEECDCECCCAIEDEDEDEDETT